MGVTVRQKTKGTKNPWWVFISHNGNRESKKIGDKKAADVVASKLRAKIKLGEFSFGDKEQKKTFKDYAEVWLKTTVPATCKPSTESDYKALLENHIKSVFYDEPVIKINRLEIKNFLMEKAKEGYASSTVTHMRNVISGILNLAVDDEIIAINPAHKLGKNVIRRSPQKNIEPLTKEELSTLLEAFKKYFPVHYPLALTLARTGMRLGEAIALQWGDIDFSGRFIHVQRGMSRGKIETPKNGKTRRVDMSQQLTDTLLNLKQSRKIEPIDRTNGWIFTSVAGTPVDTSHWRSRVFCLALEKAGLRKIRIHDLRHTYASLLLQAGESLAYIRDQLGHHSIKVTVDIYGHLAPEGNKDAVDRLDDDAPGCTLYAPKQKEANHGNG